MIPIVELGASMNRYLLAISVAAVLASNLSALALTTEEDALAHKRKAIQFQSKGMLVRAIGEYQKALQLNPSDPSCHNNLGLAMKEMDLLDDAENELRAAIELKPTANYHFNLGVVLMRKSSLTAAGEQFRKAVELNDKDADVHFRLAQIAMLEGKAGDAEQAIRCALELKPSVSVYSQLLGDVLLRQLKTDQALLAYKRAAFILGQRHDYILDNKIEYAAYLMALSKADSSAAATEPSPTSSY